MGAIIKLDAELNSKLFELIERLDRLNADATAEYDEDNKKCADSIVNAMFDIVRKNSDIRWPNELDLMEKIMTVLGKLPPEKLQRLYEFRNNMHNIFDNSVDRETNELNFLLMLDQVQVAKQRLAQDEDDKISDETVSKDIIESLCGFVAIWNESNQNYRGNTRSEFEARIKVIVEEAINELIGKAYGEERLFEAKDHARATTDGLIKCFESAYAYQRGAEQPAQTEGESGLRGLLK